MSRFLLNTPANLDEIYNFISETLNVAYGKQPTNIVFVCGDAHRPLKGPGKEMDLCNQISEWIFANRFAPFCSKEMSMNKVSLHLECGNDPSEIQSILRGAEISGLRDLGLLDQNISGWEPIGFANVNEINDFMIKPVLDLHEKAQVYSLINKSNVYFRSIGEEWTVSVLNSLNELAETVELNEEARLRAMINYQNTLLFERINANMALAAGMNQSIHRTLGMSVHFVSVGNAHLVEGITIINGIAFTEFQNVVGMSIGRLPAPV